MQPTDSNPVPDQDDRTLAFDPRRRFQRGFVAMLVAFIVHALIESTVEAASIEYLGLHGVGTALYFAVVLCSAFVVGSLGALVFGASYAALATLSGRIPFGRRSIGGRLSSESLMISAFMIILAVEAYRIGFSKVHRGLNYLHRMIDSDVDYLLSVEPLSDLTIALWIAPPIAGMGVLLALWRRRRIAAATRRAATHGPSFGRRAILACSAAAAIVVEFVNCTAYVNIYRHIHVALWILTVVIWASLYAAMPQTLLRGIETRIFRGRAIAVLFVAVVAASTILHVVLESRRSVEAACFVHSTASREEIRILRALIDRDGDGASPYFGGGDADDSDDDVHPGYFEIAENGIDDDGFGGDVSRASLPRDRAERRLRASELQPVDRVVLLTIDALRADRVGFCDSPLGLTPRIDALAQRGARFRRAYSQAAFTRFSFGSIFTSQWAGILEAGLDDVTPLPRLLVHAGIDTAGIATSFFGRIGFERMGFTRLDVTIDDARTPVTADVTTDAALVELRAAHGRRFLWVHYFDPHAPHVADGVEGTESEIVRYHGEIRGVDAAIGRLVDALDAEPDVRTAIILGADHGDEFGDHGGEFHGVTLYEESIHVPLLLVAPGIPSLAIDRCVRNLDIAPTIVELFGLPRYARHRGHSLVELALRGADEGFDHAVTAETEEGLIARLSADGRYKYLLHRRDAFEELYDLVADPLERRNLIDVEPAMADELRGDLGRWAASEIERLPERRPKHRLPR